MKHYIKRNVIIGSCIVVLWLFASLSFAKNQNTSAISDATITQLIIDKLVADPVTSSSNITVDTVDHIVTLRGNVKTKQEITSAVKNSESIKGVENVNSYILVKGSSQPLSDAVITAKIKGIYIRENLIARKWVSITDIHVETKNGVVYLSGRAVSEQVYNAITLARSVKGVKNVIVRMKVIKECQ